MHECSVLFLIYRREFGEGNQKLANAAVKYFAILKIRMRWATHYTIIDSYAIVYGNQR